MANPRQEQLLGGFIDGTPIFPPVTRLEFYLAAMSDESVTPPSPQTRTEKLLARAVEKIRGGGGDEPFGPGDEGKVVHNGQLVLQADGYADANGTVDTRLIGRMTVNVPTYGPPDEGKVVTVSGGAASLTAQTSRSVTANGDYDTTTNSSVSVCVPTYGTEDAGKVVTAVGGTATLTAQGVQTVGVNGPVDTTAIRELTVAVNPYLFPFASPLTLTAAGPVRVLTVMLYTQTVTGWQISGAIFAYDGTTWTLESKDGLGTFEISSSGATATITVEPPSTGTLQMRGYAYL